MPISAVAVLTVEDSFVLVNSPVTAEGVINRVTPLPLEVLMVVSSNTHSVPSTVGVHSGLKVPVLELSVHTVGLTAASKLPLLCARAIDAESMAIANTDTDCFMILLLHLEVIPAQSSRALPRGECRAQSVQFLRHSSAPRAGRIRSHATHVPVHCRARLYRRARCRRTLHSGCRTREHFIQRTT